jgi:hypothetical protein
MEIKKGSQADNEMAAMKQLVEQRFPELARKLANPEYQISPQEISQIKAQILGNMHSPQKKRDALILDTLLHSDSWVSYDE